MDRLRVCQRRFLVSTLEGPPYNRLSSESKPHRSSRFPSFPAESIRFDEQEHMTYHRPVSAVRPPPRLITVMSQNVRICQVNHDPPPLSQQLPTDQLPPHPKTAMSLIYVSRVVFSTNRTGIPHIGSLQAQRASQW